MPGLKQWLFNETNSIPSYLRDTWPVDRFRRFLADDPGVRAPGRPAPGAPAPPSRSVMASGLPVTLPPIRSTPPHTAAPRQKQPTVDARAVQARLQRLYGIPANVTGLALQQAISAARARGVTPPPRNARMAQRLQRAETDRDSLPSIGPVPRYSGLDSIKAALNGMQSALEIAKLPDTLAGRILSIPEHFDQGVAGAMLGAGIGTREGRSVYHQLQRKYGDDACDHLPSFWEAVAPEALRATDRVPLVGGLTRSAAKVAVPSSLPTIALAGMGALPSAATGLMGLQMAESGVAGLYDLLAHPDPNADDTHLYNNIVERLFDLAGGVGGVAHGLGGCELEPSQGDRPGAPAAEAGGASSRLYQANAAGRPARAAAGVSPATRPGASPRPGGAAETSASVASASEAARPAAEDASGAGGATTTPAAQAPGLTKGHWVRGPRGARYVVEDASNKDLFVVRRAGTGTPRTLAPHKLTSVGFQPTHDVVWSDGRVTPVYMDAARGKPSAPYVMDESGRGRVVSPGCLRPHAEPAAGEEGDVARLFEREGQYHHVISNRIWAAIEKNDALKGTVNRNDPRYIWKARSLNDHLGYSAPFREIDTKAVKLIKGDGKLTRSQLMSFLEKEYSKPGMAERFPNRPSIVTGGEVNE